MNFIEALFRPVQRGFFFHYTISPWRAGAMSFLCPSISKVEHMACCSMKTLQLWTEWMNEWASDWINEWHHNCHWMNNWMMSNLCQAICWSPKKQKWRPSSALKLLQFHHSVQFQRGSESSPLTNYHAVSLIFLEDTHYFPRNYIYVVNKSHTMW